MYDKKLKAKLFLNLLKIRLFAKKKRKKEAKSKSFLPLPKWPLKVFDKDFYF